MSAVSLRSRAKPGVSKGGVGSPPNSPSWRAAEAWRLRDTEKEQGVDAV